jgi:hypothetical protein
MAGKAAQWEEGARARGGCAASGGATGDLSSSRRCQGWIKRCPDGKADKAQLPRIAMCLGGLQRRAVCSVQQQRRCEGLDVNIGRGGLWTMDTRSWRGVSVVFSNRLHDSIDWAAGVQMGQAESICIQMLLAGSRIGAHARES